MFKEIKYISIATIIAFALAFSTLIIPIFIFIGIIYVVYKLIKEEMDSKDQS